MSDKDLASCIDAEPQEITPGAKVGWCRLTPAETRVESALGL